MELTTHRRAQWTAAGLMLSLCLSCGAPKKTETKCERPEPAVSLPTDDGMHHEKTEWWYWTGHLSDGAGRWFGFQTTFFLFTFSGAHALLSNVALTDIEGHAFHRQAGFSFSSPDTVTNGFRFRLGPGFAEGGDGYDRLEATLPDAGYSLSLEPGASPTLQHGDGREDYAVGGYTYYYSRTRMPASGTVTVGDEKIAVQGTAWFDHQWGDLDAIQKRGWDWFALQLDDGRDVMLFLVHGAVLGGTITDATGCARELSAQEVRVTSTGSWKGPQSGCEYPQGWAIELPDLQLEVKPLLAEQEFYNARDNSKTYWEGASVVTGTVSGRAYVELTGYCNL